MEGVLKWKPFWFIGLLCILQFGSHAPYLKLPAVGNHVWRQVNTLTVARNYHEEDMRIWLPRIDKRYHFSGITGNAFPAYEFTLACLYKVFGYSESTHRWWSLFLSMLALAGMYFLGFSFIAKREFAAICSLTLFGIPEFYYHSINAVPDLFGLVCMLWGWYAARLWVRNGSFLYFSIACLLLTLGGLVKILFLIPGLLIAFDIWQHKQFFSKRRGIETFVFAFITITSVFAWYKYANWLTFKDWLNEFVHDVRFPDSWRDFFEILFGNLIRDLPETWLGYPLLLGFVLGIQGLLKIKTSRIMVVIACISAFLVYLPLQRQFMQHGYYIIAFLPMMVLSTAYGFLRILSSKHNSLMLLLVLGGFWSWIRIYQNWQEAHWRIKPEMARASFRDSARKLSDTSIRWIVGPDQTGCVYFYYLHAKGFPWYNMQEDKTIIARHYAWGARGFITNDTIEMRKRMPDSLSLESAGHAGGFFWYKIRKQ